MSNDGNLRISVSFCNAEDHCTDPKERIFTPVSNVSALAQAGASKCHVTCSASTPLATEARPDATFLRSSSSIENVASLASVVSGAGNESPGSNEIRNLCSWLAKVTECTS